MASAKVVGGDARWLIVSCRDCSRPFDTPKEKNNVPQICDECVSPRNLWKRQHRAAA